MHNYTVSNNYFYLIIIICLDTVIWFQVINDNKTNKQLQVQETRFNINSLVIWHQVFPWNSHNFQTDLFDP